MIHHRFNQIKSNQKSSYIELVFSTQQQELQRIYIYIYREIYIFRLLILLAFNIAIRNYCR